jgi:hypothetical protein
VVELASDNFSEDLRDYLTHEEFFKVLGLGLFVELGQVAEAESAFV